MADEISLEITETITKVEVTEDVTSINITPNITSVELKGISISNAGSATAMSYAGESNTLGYGSTVAASLDHINTNGLNKNTDQTIDGNITFADGHTITFPTSGYTALELNDNSMNLAGITASADITSATKMEAPLFKGDLEGAVHFKASGDNLSRGDVVYISGYQGQRTTVDKADASDSTKMPAFGIVNAVQGGNVDILTFGSMLHLSTTDITTGTELYVSASTPGGYETSAPTGEGNLVQKIAKVVRGDSNSGSIKIMGAGRTNATPNLNSGNIFLGNASNISTTASFDTTFASSFATRTTSDLTEGTNEYYTDAKADARVNSVLGTGVDNIVTTGYLRGPDTFTIDPAGHGNTSGKVVIAGDLQVDGTTTTLNSTIVNIDDKNLVLAANASSAAEANTGGILIGGAGLNMLYSSGLDALVLNKDFRAQGYIHPASLLDSSGELGISGQALFSTGTGTEWSNISTTLNISADSGNSEAINMLTETLDIEGVAPISTVTGTNKVSISLDDVGSPGTFGGSQTIPQITVDAKGRVTSVSEISGEVGPRGATGATGAAGIRGSNGANTLQFNLETDTSIVNTLSSGLVQLNKLNYGDSGLRLKISSTDDSGTNIKDFIRYLTSSTNPDIKAHITLTNQADPDRFLLLEVTNDEYETSDDNETLVSVNRVAGLSGGNSIQDGIVGTTSNPTILVSFLRAADFGQFDSIEDLPNVSSTITPSNRSILSYDSLASEYRPDLVENFALIEKTYIKVETGAGIVKGSPYGLVGMNPSTDVPIVGLTDANNEQLCLGIAFENVSNGQTGRLLTRGILKNVDTSTTNIPGTGNFVYISQITGGLTRTPPILRTATTQQVGYILQVGTTDGILYVDIGSKAIGVADLNNGEFAYGGPDGQQKAYYRDRALPITAPFGAVGSRSYQNVLTAVDSSGQNVHSFPSTTIEKLNLGDKFATNISELNIFPGSTGKCILHFGNQTNPNNFNLQESQRLHTTSNGIHVGNNLQDGSYTAGDLHVNNDTGYGLVIGQSITNAGHNSFLVGMEHNISGTSANFMAVGYDIDTTNAVHQSLGVGTHIDFVGTGDENNPHWGMLGVGRFVKVEDSFGVALGYGANGDEIKSTGLASFAQGYKARALADYTFAIGGAQTRDGAPIRPEASVLGAMCMGPNTVSGTHSIGIGKFNTVQGDSGAAAIGTYNTAKGNKSITLGEGNLTQDTAGSLSQVALGTSHELYGDSSVALGKSCFTPTAIANIVAGYSVKAPQRNISGFPAQGDGQVVVGAFNDNLKEWASDDYANDIVAPLHFSVGTGSADGSRYTSMAIGPKSPSANPSMTSPTGESGFCGIIMQALADSSSYTDAEASHANSHVPVGGLYRTGNIVKIRLA